MCITLYMHMYIVRVLYENIPYYYSRKVWQFGGLYYNRQIKIRQDILLAYMCMAIPYRTALPQFESQFKLHYYTEIPLMSQSIGIFVFRRAGAIVDDRAGHCEP